MRNERPLDALIDEAARRLVAGEPSSSLRSSVRERIGRRRLGWFVVPAWGTAAAMVVAVLIVGRALSGPFGGPVGRTLSGPPVRPTEERPTIDRGPAAVASPSSAPDATQPVRIEARQFTRRAAAVIPPPPDEEPIVPQIAIEPLATVPLSAAQIAAEVSSGVMPIDIAPLQIEPLLGQ